MRLFEKINDACAGLARVLRLDRVDAALNDAITARRARRDLQLADELEAAGLRQAATALRRCGGSP